MCRSRETICVGYESWGYAAAAKPPNGKIHIIQLTLLTKGKTRNYEQRKLFREYMNLTRVNIIINFMTIAFVT